MSKYLVTGIDGFAGPALANLLFKEGHEIYGLTRRTNGMSTDILDTVSPECFESIKFVHANLEDYSSVEKVFIDHKFTGVFHLAAQSHIVVSIKDPVGTFRDNVMGSVNLITAIERHNPECKLMFTSTSEVYGNEGKDGRKIKEDELIAPVNAYGCTKAAIDLYMQEEMRNDKVDGFIVRPFSYTGIRRGRTFSIASDCYQTARIMLGLQEPIIRVGNLGTNRVVMDSKDCVRAMYLLMTHPYSSGHIFNICGDVPRKMEFFTDYFIAASGANIEKVVDPALLRPIDIYYQHGDTTALKQLTGWKTEISIEQTLDDMLKYWIKKLS